MQVGDQPHGIKELERRGVDFKEVDIGSANEVQFVALLRDIDIVLSAIEWTQLKLQYPLIDAANNSGVKL